MEVTPFVTKITLNKGCTNPGACSPVRLNFCGGRKYYQHNCCSFLPDIKKYVLFYMRQAKDVTGCCRVVGLQYGLGFTAPLRRTEFGGGF